jgi:hypothetical protein
MFKTLMRSFTSPSMLVAALGLCKFRTANRLSNPPVVLTKEGERLLRRELECGCGKVVFPVMLYGIVFFAPR